MDLKQNIREELSAVSPTMLQWVMQNFQKRLGECVDKGRHLTDTVFRKWILQLKCFELKIILARNLRKKTVYFSFYFNLKIIRFFGRTLYKQITHEVFETHQSFYTIYNGDKLQQFA